MTYYKFHGVPITHEKQTFEFLPTNNLLAISKKKKFIEISETNLKMYCRYFNAREIWGCPALRILSKNYNKTASCLMSLFQNDLSSAAIYCPKKQTTNHEIIYQSGKDSFNIINPAERKAEITCLDPKTKRISHNYPEVKVIKIKG